MIRKLFLLTLLAAVLFAASGCQTIAGLGGDIKWTAEKTADLVGGGPQE
jgi:predicted small secreted protein